MRTFYLNKLKAYAIGKCRSIITVRISIIILFLFGEFFTVSSQAILFDFDNASPSTPLPISQTVSGITAYFSATVQGYSIQNANTLGFTPTGFSGLCIYPSSIYLSDLLVRFDQTITDFSVMYSCQELGCDDAATMRVTAYMKGSLVGSNTMVARHPGTWPVDTLRCSFVQGFDSVVVHYDSRPPTCQDYGVIFLADNMRVTALNPVGFANLKEDIERLVITNPVSQFATITFTLSRASEINVTIYDITGKLIRKIETGVLTNGDHELIWDAKQDGIKAGVYILKVSSDNFSRSAKIMVVK